MTSNTESENLEAVKLSFVREFENATTPELVQKAKTRFNAYAKNMKLVERLQFLQAIYSLSQTELKSQVAS